MTFKNTIQEQSNENYAGDRTMYNTYNKQETKIETLS